MVKIKEKIFLTERSMVELLEGKKIYDDDTIIYPPKTKELKRELLKVIDKSYNVSKTKKVL